MMQSKTESPADELPIFWEKTVEWAYVRKHLDLADFAAPLDGFIEKYGDAVVGFEKLNWCLIEFKRNRATLKSEEKKYPFFNKKFEEGIDKKVNEKWCSDCEVLLSKYAKNVTPLVEAPHFLIYGETVKLEAPTSVTDHDEDENKLPAWEMKLHVQRYWSSWEEDKLKTDRFREAVFIKEIGDLKSISSDFNTFQNYLELLLSAKGGETNASQGGFGLKNVVGTHESGMKVVTTVADFVKVTLGLDLQNQYNHTPDGSEAGSRFTL